MDSYKQGGFDFNKYIITKSNGNPIDPEALYFVLRYDRDPHARVALAAYAQSVRTDNPQLADELLMEVKAANLVCSQRESEGSHE
jgi:hypothetical protein